LERVFHETGEKPKRKACHGIAGIVNEARRCRLGCRPRWPWRRP
jgi:hypothetical protein